MTVPQSLPSGEGVTAGDERGIISNPEGRKEKRIATHTFGMLAMTGNVILSAAKNPYLKKTVVELENNATKKRLPFYWRRFF